ncbi:MAG: DUF559 domain-containing protein [Actinobacteria bacterium]|nr:DUF559 domain-containing protein [Actinomycetota bacterium]
MISRSEVQILLPGVFRSAAWPTSREQLMHAACLRNPRVAVGFTTAGQIHGLRKMTDPRVHVLVPHGSSPELEGVIVHRCRRIDDDDLVVGADGLQITSVARTLFDVGGVIGYHRVSSALENALDKGVVSLAEIAGTTARLYHRRRPGSREIRAVLSQRGEWEAAVQSDLELRVLEAIRGGGIRAPILQHEMECPDGRMVRLDFAWLTERVALEVDHSFWHAGSAESRKDKSRDRQLALMGWLTVRLTEDDVRDGLTKVIGELRGILETRTS